MEVLIAMTVSLHRLELTLHIMVHVNLHPHHQQSKSVLGVWVKRVMVRNPVNKDSNATSPQWIHHIIKACVAVRLMTIVLIRFTAHSALMPGILRGLHISELNFAHHVILSVTLAVIKQAQNHFVTKDLAL
jgi:hypothetical protein